MNAQVRVPVAWRDFWLPGIITGLAIGFWFGVWFGPYITR